MKGGNLTTTLSRTLAWAPLSARLGAVSVAELLVVVAGSPLSVVSPQGWLFPCLRSRCPAMSLSNRCSGSELVCLCVHVRMRVCLYVSVSLWVFMGVGGLVCFIIVVRHFVLLFLSMKGAI